MKTTKVLFTTIAALSFACNLSAAAFSYDFTTGSGFSSDFTESPSSDWTEGNLTVAGDDMGNGYNFDSSQTGTALLTESGSGSSFQDFEMSTSFQVGDIRGASTPTWGMALLGDSTSLGKYILLDYSNAGNFRILNVGGGTGNGTVISDSTSLSYAFDRDTTYTMSLTGSYVGTTLTLSAVLTDGASTSSAIGGSFDASTDFDGDVLGLRARSASGTTVQYESFSLAVVPEPSSIAMVFVALSSLVVLRRRR